MIKGKYIVKSGDQIIAEKENLITTNGFYMINKYLAKSSLDWAGSLVIGALGDPTNNPTAITDKTLYFETGRVPVTLKSYSKFNPKYIITNKALTSNVATLTFQSPATPMLAQNYTVQISGVDATFNGSFLVTNLTTVTQPTSTTLGTYTITYAKTATNVASTNTGLTSASLITVTLDNSNVAVYNNEIVVKASLDPSASYQINEVGVLPLRMSDGATKDNVALTSFAEVSTSDPSISKWSSATTTYLVGTADIMGSSTSPTGYSWPTGGSSVTFNISSTAGLKVGSSVFISGVTLANGTAPAGAATITAINGNYQIVVTMTSGTNSSGTTWGGYGGTVSLNSTTAVVPSNTGQFNIKLVPGNSVTLSNMTFNASSYTAADSLMLLYYAPASVSGQTITLVITDSNSNTYSLSSVLSSTSAGWYMTRFQLTGFPSYGAIISSVQLGLTGSTTIILDVLKFVSDSYWSAHPQSGAANIFLPAEYQLTSRSLFSTPIIKYAGQQMDIEYHIQVT